MRDDKQTALDELFSELLKDMGDSNIEKVCGKPAPPVEPEPEDPLFGSW